MAGDRSKGEKIQKWFNPAAFTVNALGTVGTGGRGQLRAPGMWTVNYSLVKEFALVEAVRLQLRGEFFNLFNHADLGTPNSNVLAGVNFGRITTAGSPRIVQVSAKVVF